MESTSGFGPRKLARLFEIGWRRRLSGEDGRSRAAHEEALRGLLARQVSLDAAAPDSAPVVLARSCDELDAHVGQTLADVILSPGASLDALKTVKDYAKALVRRPDLDAAATAVYYAAIASALVFQGRRITQHSYEKIEESLGALEAKTWLVPELRPLFSKAREVCRLLTAKTETTSTG